MDTLDGLDFEKSFLDQMATKHNCTFVDWSAGYLQGLNRRYWNFEWNAEPIRESERQAIAEHVAKLTKN